MGNPTVGTETVRLTEQESQANVHAVLQLCDSGRCAASWATGTSPSRPHGTAFRKGLRTLGYALP